MRSNSIELVCEKCRKSFRLRPCDLKCRVGRFCSRKCSDGCTGSPPEVRFFKHIEASVRANGCLHWTGAKGKQGYGSLGSGGTTVLAHRVAYKIAYGNFDASLDVLHSCDNPSCVNPLHLFLGTHQDNMDDMISKGRKAIGEKSKCAKLTTSQVKEIRKRWGSGGATQEQLGREYGVGGNTICVIVHRKTWKYVD